MSKELNLVDTLTFDQSDAAATNEITKLDELSLALVGGGVIVDLG